MIVRSATEDDTPALLDMGREFYATTDYPALADYDEASVMALIDYMRDTGVLLVAEVADALVGMAGLILAPFPFNRRITTANEVVWWVTPGARDSGAGVALMRAIPAACKALGASTVNMVLLSSSPPQAGCIYERMGYTLCESSYMRVI